MHIFQVCVACARKWHVQEKEEGINYFGDHDYKQVFVFHIGISMSPIKCEISANRDRLGLALYVISEGARASPNLPPSHHMRHPCAQANNWDCPYSHPMYILPSPYSCVHHLHSENIYMYGYRILQEAYIASTVLNLCSNIC